MNLKDVTLSGCTMQALSFAFDYDTKHLFFANDVDCVAVIVETHDLGIDLDVYIDIETCFTNHVDINRFIDDLRFETERNIQPEHICFINELTAVERFNHNYPYTDTKNHKMYDQVSVYCNCLNKISHDGNF